MSGAALEEFNNSNDLVELDMEIFLDFGKEADLPENENVDPNIILQRVLRRNGSIFENVAEGNVSGTPTEHHTVLDQASNITAHSVHTGDLRNQPTEERQNMSADADTQWIDLAIQPVLNPQSQDKQILAIRKQSTGYAVGYGAGPLSFFDIFKIQYLIPRPLVPKTVSEIAEMFHHGDRYGWRNPLVMQLPQDTPLYPGLPEIMAKVNPNTYDSGLPVMLRAEHLTDHIICVLSMLWTERDPDNNGEFLSPAQLESLQAQVKAWQNERPLVRVLQGRQRLAAECEVRLQIGKVRTQMIKSGREGNTEEAKALADQLDQMVKTSSFLIDVYDSSLEMESALVLALNQPNLPSAPPTYGELMYHLRYKMKKGYPAAPWDCIYTCSQLVTLGRQEVVGLPKSDEAYKSVHKTLSNPILVQMALTHSPMMAVLDSCVQPGLSDLVKQEAGLARAYVWLSLELLRKLCLRQVPNCADFLALQELAKDERDPNVAVCMAASELWRKSTNVSWEMLAYRTPKYAEEVEPNYAAVFKSYVLPLLLRHLETRPHVVWRHEEIVGASRFCLSTVGLHLLHSQHAAVAELGRAMIVYSMLPLTSPTGGEFGFTPEAVLPSRSVFRVLYNQVWSTVGSFGAQLLGFALNRYSALLGDHARHSMPTGDYTKCCCSGTDALVHRVVTSAPGLADNELPNDYSFCSLIQVIHNMDNRTTLSRFAQVAEAAYSILHLQHDTPFETAINLLKKPCGVGAAFNAKWIQQKIPCLATCAEGKLKQDFIQASQKLRSYLGQREHQDLAQNEFLEHHFPFASEILQKFLKGVDLHTWFFAQSPSAKKPLPALALGYGFYYCIYQLLLVIPLLTYCQSARDLFDLAYSMVPEADFWFKSEHYMDVLNQPVQSLHIQVQPGVVATISHASSSAVAQVKTPHLPLEVSVQPSVTAAPRRSTPKRKGKSAAPARPDQPLFFFNVPKISGDVEVQGSAAPATLQDLNPPCILPEGSSSNNQGPIPTAGPSSRPAPQQLQPPAWPQPEHRVNLGPRDTTPKYQPLTTTKDIVTAYSQQVATDYELPAQLLHNHYAQLYAVRDQPSLLLTFPADPKPTLEALAAEAIEVLDKLSLDRRWFLRSLVAKIKVEMDTGADGMYYTLGPTVNAHKDAYTRRMAKTLMSMNLGITESAAINEALRIAHGDGMHSSNLVFWDPTSGRVELNLEPMLPACIKDEYTGPKQILIGQVEQYEHSPTQAKIDCLLPFLYGPGPSEQQSHERVEKMLHHSDVVGTLRITGSGNPMERATKKSKAMRGDAASAFSTGRFFGNAVVPWMVHKEDDQFNHLKEVVTTLDVQLKSESQKRAQDFVANFLPEIFPGVQWMAGGCLTDSMELDDLYDEIHITDHIIAHQTVSWSSTIITNSNHHTLHIIMQSPGWNTNFIAQMASQGPRPSTQAPAQDHAEELPQSDIMVALIHKLSHLSPDSGVLCYLHSLQNSNTVEEPVPSDVQQELEIAKFFRGWAKIKYCGPQVSHGYVNQAPFLNPRTTEHSDLQTLVVSFQVKKLDYRFPIDLLVNMSHVTAEFEQAIHTDGSKADCQVPLLELLDAPNEEATLLYDTWMWQDTSTGLWLTLDEHNDKVIRLRECQENADRPQARILAGRRRNEAMQLWAKQTYAKQKEFVLLLQRSASLTDAESYKMEKLATEIHKEGKMLEFRVRIFDAAMPRHLQVELAKNHDAEFRRGATIGEDIYMFRLQTLDVLELLTTTHAGKERDHVLNIWNLTRNQSFSQVTQKSAKSTQASTKGKLKLDTLLVSPMCVEMMLSCGHAGTAFDLVLTVTNMQFLTGESGGLALATLWLDMCTLLKVCNFVDVPPAYNKAERFVQNHEEPNSSEGEEGAVKIWSEFCHAGSQVDMPAGLAAFDKETHKAYTERWTKIYGVNPSEDETCNPPRFHHPDEIVRKRKLLWQFGLSLSASANRLKHLLGISIRVYACLPLHVSGLDARACFHPSADLPNKKKMAQIERQSRVFLKGAGLAMLSMALARHDIIWFMSKHVENWYMTSGATHRVLERCTRLHLQVPEVALSTVISILHSKNLKHALLVSSDHYPDFGVGGTQFNKLKKKCSTIRSSSRDAFVILNEVTPGGEDTGNQLRADLNMAIVSIVDYTQAQDPSQLPTHLENHPVLLQLTGTHFFNNFELMRFVHGGPAGVKSSTLKNNAKAVTSAAIGMGIFVHQLEKQVMLPLMTEHMRARYILQAAVLVEHFSPSFVDGYPESTWWTDSIPHTVSLDLNQDLPQAVQTLLDSRVEQQAQDAALAADLDITDPADITLTALPPQGEWPEELNHLALLPQGSAPAAFNDLSSIDGWLTQQSHQAFAEQTVFGQQDQAERHAWAETKEGEVHGGVRAKRWDSIIAHLPLHVAYPGNPSLKVLHHLQGSEIGLRPTECDVNLIMDHISYAIEHIPMLLEGIFAEQKIMRTQLEDLTRLAAAQPQPQDFIVNVLVPTLLRLKENHIVQLARIFMQRYDLTVEEAQAESLYLALSNGYWENDLISVDDNNNVWINYASTLPRVGHVLLKQTKVLICNVGPRTLADHQLAAMFLDACGAGVSERALQYATSAAQVLQAAQFWNFPLQRVHFTDQQHWNAPNTMEPPILHLDKTRYDDPNYLRGHGWDIASRDVFFTTWTRGSSLASGVFVDWDCMAAASSTPIAHWGQIRKQLEEYGALAKRIWYPLVQSAVADVQRVLERSILEPTLPHSIGPGITHNTAQSIAQPALALSPQMSPAQGINPQGGIHMPVTELSPTRQAEPTGQDDISTWSTQPVQPVVPSSDPITTWDTVHDYPVVHGPSPMGANPEPVQTQEILVPGTPSDTSEQAKPQRPFSGPQYSDFPEPVEATPEPDVKLLASCGSPKADIPWSSQPPFTMETHFQVGDTECYDDSDDPDHDHTQQADAGEPTDRQNPFVQIRSQLVFDRQSHEQLSQADEEFVVETAFHKTFTINSNDSDDPDHVPISAAGPSKGTPARAGVAPTQTISGPVLSRKRAATKTSPQLHDYKRTTRGGGN